MFHFSIVVVLTVGLPPGASIRTGLSAEDLLRVEELQKTLAAVAEEARPSVVAIRALRRFAAPHAEASVTTLPSSRGRPVHGVLVPSIGSGVIIDRQGLILTNEHVVHDVEPDRIECILSTGDRYIVQGMTTDPRSDLAVLSIDADNLKPMVWGDVDSLRQGHFVIVMGNPLGTALDGDGRAAMSFGIISALGQDLTQKLDPDRYYGNLIQTDARINPGNSGGPLINLKGEVVGITTAISSRTGGSDGVGYAISLGKDTRRIVDQLVEGQEVRYGYIGVHLQDRNRPRIGGRASARVVISSVEPESPAQRAGLKEGDAIVGFDNKPVENADELVRLVAMSGVGKAVPLSIVRDGRPLDLNVVPGPRPAPGGGVNIEPDFTWRGITFSVANSGTRGRFALPESVTGPVVSVVVAGSPADKAGLRPGDVIAALNGEPVGGFRRFRRSIQGLGGTVKLTLEGKPSRELVIP
ncbi:MAG: trypsin-like peptidase domain-containing protein [Phycisphaerae bacterium]